MATFPSIAKNENGFVLVAALLTLILLVMVGISATTTTTLEIQIAGNEKAYNMAFFEADGGDEVGAELLEHNIACGAGFSDVNGTGERIIGDATDDLLNTRITTLDFWYNERDSQVLKPLSAAEQAALGAAVVPPEIPDVFLPGTVDPANPDATVPRTMISFAGQTLLSSGGAIQMAAGYERLGKSAGSGGAIMVYDITSRHIGLGNSESTVHQQWRHVLGQEGDCNY
ncbi:MAG: hypothetical protein COZ12_02500 [Deltaproteobacteria bacterium CG_4_10_14_3_um_filter_60_8]|nr:MAG: hypothetical protein AUK28_10690 [Desulfobacterales bacterium CG2_30_60_27]PIY22872.1 MAG: hypothetical protein COZ12_02500 [Deltaproteobacteria bacterium CG_4_10_14_3_um_filter_60_8]